MTQYDDIVALQTKLLEIYKDVKTIQDNFGLLQSLIGVKLMINKCSAEIIEASMIICNRIAHIINDLIIVSERINIIMDMYMNYEDDAEIKKSIHNIEMCFEIYRPYVEQTITYINDTFKKFE